MNKWKTVILSRYLGDFQPAQEDNDTAIKKSSEDIKYDLEGMTTLSIDEISEEMVLREYKIMIDHDGKPKWLMEKADNSQKLIK